VHRLPELPGGLSLHAGQAPVELRRVGRHRHHGQGRQAHVG
jgi:hypothetical protein